MRARGHTAALRAGMKMGSSLRVAGLSDLSPCVRPPNGLKSNYVTSPSCMAWTVDPFR